MTSSVYIDKLDDIVNKYKIQIILQLKTFWFKIKHIYKL